MTTARQARAVMRAIDPARAHAQRVRLATRKMPEAIRGVMDGGRDRYLSPECDKGAGYCDGYSPDGLYCECGCHAPGVVFATIEDAAAWHREEREL